MSKNPLSSNQELPLVYSCSGCSDAAQTTNNIALRLDREKRATMGCIAGVGGGVPSHIKKAKETKEVIALDGCSLCCVKACLNKCDVEPTVHINLSDWGVKKQAHTDFDPAQAEVLYKKMIAMLE